MASDMEILKALGEEIGVELRPFSMSSLTHYGAVGYAFDETKRVIGLALSERAVETVHAILFQLQSLQTLYLSFNRLTSLPPEIAQLRSLQTLYLHSNRLTSLPPEIAQLRSLQTLDLSFNRLTSLPPEIAQLRSLQTLDLSFNRLTSLPPEIAELELKYTSEQVSVRTGCISLLGNPLESPPLEIIKQGRQAIIAYFRSLEGEKRPLNEVKILLVGDGAVGKTSLVKRLLGEPFDPNESQTHGINIRHWQVEHDDRDIVGHFWDFGGQEIMHATHQFFLSKRSVYVLVLDGRKDEKTETWLKTIESFGGDSPVLVVLNKIDENPGFDVNRRFLQEKYPGIRGFYPVSCAADRGIEEFHGALEESLTKVKILGAVWPENWFQVKQELEQMGDHFINYDSYVDLCDDKGVEDPAGQSTLVEFLNDLGVVVHFQDFELQDVYVLEPKWVTEGVYKIINSEELARTKGLLELRSLPDILKPEDDYPRDKQRYFIDLMKKFELCYEIDQSTVLVPDLLEVQEPAFDFGTGDLLRFYIDYDFLPRSVMPRFIVKMHQDIHRQLRWRTGVVLRSETFQSTAVVRCDYEARRIDIRVAGPRKQDYFAAVLYFLREINDGFEKLGFVERVPLPDNPGAAVSYENLLRQEQAGIRDFLPDGGTRICDVKDLLGIVQNEETTDAQILEVLKEILDKVEDGGKAELSEGFAINAGIPGVANVSVTLNTVLEWIRSTIRKRSRR